MKKLFLTLTVLALALFNAGAEEKTRTFSFGDIESLDVNFCYQVHVTEGNSGSVKIVYDSAFDEFIVADYNSKSRMLVMDMDKKMPKKLTVGRSPQIHVYVEMDEITALQISGAASVTFDGEYKGNDLRIELSGASKISNLNIDGKSLRFTCSGASNGSIEGSFAGNVDLDLSGASRLKCNCNGKEFSAEVSGASRLDFEGECTAADVRCSGASSASLEGSATEAEFECSGASKIEAENYITKNLRADLSGASKAEVHATSNLTYTVSRACKIVYHGDAVLKNQTSEPNVVKGR